MASRYLLDTNIASYIIKGNVPAVRHRLVKVPMPQVAVSAVTEGELRYGVARRPDLAHLQKVVDEFLLRVTVLPWDSDAAQQYGQLRATLERKGRVMGNLDMMIGAQALASGLILVTNDQAFSRIGGLKIEDWTKP
ncbi:MAG TPA: type II toxin-antitoxin system VapC family toxin [Bryobacteraceae bacterium]|nr:type II toxin-antitoxin system VapC family toxin [Bryobacteraceae bacterium]